MTVKHPLINIIRSQKHGIPEGICSICSASKYVIEAAIERAKKNDTLVLVEATANQVNQYGGYTAMKPSDFRDFVFSIARRAGFPTEKVILGGDHLGPLCWKTEKSESAMRKAEELIAQYVLAGFTKIHIDTSMRLFDDRSDIELDNAVIAERGARLAAAAERAFKLLAERCPDTIHPVYVIGSEVPIPGGSLDEDEVLQVTKPADFEKTVEVFSSAFQLKGLAEAWENVIAVVVQPGVEFGDDSIHEYRREDATGLISSLKKYPGLIFEGHSTDYQTNGRLKSMVEDGIAILKVGPALTFALREALFALNYMENELNFGGQDIELSRFKETLCRVMVQKPEHWRKYYHGNEEQLQFSMKYSLSDRCRYYLPDPEVMDSIERLVGNLKKTTIPLALISQFMPVQLAKIRNGTLENKPEALIKDRIGQVLDDYAYAVNSKAAV